MSQPDSVSPAAVVSALAAALSPATDQLRSQADILGAIDRHFATESMARSLIGRQWGTATPEQRTRLSAALLPYIARTLAQLFVEHPEGALRTGRISGEGDRCRVESRFNIPPRSVIDVAWDIHRDDTGARIFDVTIDGISMAVSLRSQFHVIIAGQGIDGLTPALEHISR